MFLKNCKEEKKTILSGPTAASQAVFPVRQRIYAPAGH